MIKYKYIDGWNKPLKNSLNNDATKSKRLTTLLEQLAHQHGKNATHISTGVKLIIQMIMNTLDQEKSLQGLFNALDLSRSRVSPFIATNDFCIKVLRCCDVGLAELKISPIFRLGPDYPEHYKSKNGKELGEEAIVGLIEESQHEFPHVNNKKFSLGIDAGEAFQNSLINYNRKLTLQIEPIEEGIIATLSCEDQTTSKVFTWEQLGVNQLNYRDAFTSTSHDLHQVA